MNVIRVKDSGVAAQMAADIFAAQLIRKPDSILGFATGSTPIELYELLVKKHRGYGLDFERAVSFNLDEYVGLAGDHPQSYRHFMMENLFKHIDIKNENIHLPNGKALDLDAECRAYDEAIERAGGIDLQLLGIGNNGHIGFNEPDGAFTLPTHRVAIQEDTIAANARFFQSEAEVPREALTMGIGAIMRAKGVVLIAGANKKAIVEAAIEGPVTPEVPASILQVHPNATILYVA